MKDKLRELLGELMTTCEMIGYATSGAERFSHRAHRDKVKAELLVILDAEGDGGSVEHCTCPACQITHASDCAVHNMPAMPAGPCDCGAIAQEKQS